MVAERVCEVCGRPGVPLRMKLHVAAAQAGALKFGQTGRYLCDAHADTPEVDDD